MRAHALCAIVSIAWICGARAQEPAYPTRTVRLVVNSQAGGTVDVVTRILAEGLSRRWTQSVIVDDVVGAGGNVGAGQVARAEPDGTTLLVSHAGPLTVNALLFRAMPYDPAQLVPVTIAASFPNVLVVGAASGFTTLADVIAAGKHRPGQLTYGSQGVGTTTHLSGALLARRAGIDLVHVPYRGSPAALIDLAGGRLDMMFDNIGTSLPQHRSGAVRILAVADRNRLEAIPDVPTLEESGFPGFRSVAWFALAAPRGTPPDLVARINRDAVAVLRDPALVSRLKALDLQVIASTPEEARAFIQSETALWGGVVKDANIEPQ